MEITYKESGNNCFPVPGGPEKRPKTAWVTWVFAFFPALRVVCALTALKSEKSSHPDHFGTVFGTIWVPKMLPKSTKNLVKLKR